MTKISRMQHITKDGKIKANPNAIRGLQQSYVKLSKSELNGFGDSEDIFEHKNIINAVEKLGANKVITTLADAFEQSEESAQEAIYDTSREGHGVLGSLEKKREKVRDSWFEFERKFIKIFRM
jgi:hypothetical protein|tara:strand:+ start:1176 stop:1544 length:369 start_codon:yes stop_codon:yes gene_type:complete